MSLVSCGVCTCHSYLGTADAVNLVTENGRRLAEVGGQLKEVVIATAAEAAAMPIPGLEGVYVVGTGSTGAAQAFFTLGAVYFTTIMGGAFAYRVPREGCVIGGQRVVDLITHGTYQRVHT